MPVFVPVLSECNVCKKSTKILQLGCSFYCHIFLSKHANSDTQYNLHRMLFFIININKTLTTYSLEERQRWILNNICISV